MQIQFGVRACMSDLFENVDRGHRLGSKEDVHATELHHVLTFGPFSAVSTPQPQIASVGSLTSSFRDLSNLHLLRTSPNANLYRLEYFLRAQIEGVAVTPSEDKGEVHVDFSDTAPFVTAWFIKKLPKGKTSAS